MEHFDLEAPADVFVGAGRKNAREPIAYRRFKTGAEAIRHVIESVEPASLPGAVIETDETRLEAADIRAIYESTDFPLARRVNKARISG
jgi:hypothetical protein